MMRTTIPRVTGYPIFIHPTTRNGRPWFMATHPDLPGCMSDGATPEEARKNLEDARELYLLDLAEDEIAPPQPFSRFVKTSGTAANSGDSGFRLLYGVASIDHISPGLDVVVEPPVVAVAK